MNNIVNLLLNISRLGAASEVMNDAQDNCGFYLTLLPSVLMTCRIISIWCSVAGGQSTAICYVLCVFQQISRKRFH